MPWKVFPVAVPCGPLCPLWLEPLKNPRRAHPSADAHGHHAIASPAPLQFAKNASRKLSARTSERMPQSNRTPVGIHALKIEPSFFDYRQRLRREGLVQLDHINVRKLQSSQLQRLRDGKHRPEAHLFGLVSSGGERNVARQRSDAQSLRPLGR